MRRRKYHKFPYIILLIANCSILIYTFYKNKDRKRLLVSLGSNISMAIIFEYFTINLLKGYRYKPRILRNKYQDHILGAVFSQGIFVPFTALFITAFHLGWKFKLMASLFYTSIELLFLRIGIYTHKWWKTSYTLILLPVYFWICDKWYYYLKLRNPAVLFVSYFHLLFVTTIHSLFFQSIIGKVKFGFGRFNSWREHFILMPLYSLIVVFFTERIEKTRNSLIIYIKMLFYRLLLDKLLIKFKLMKFEQKNVHKNLPFHIFMILLSSCYKRIVYEKPNKKSSP